MGQEGEPSKSAGKISPSLLTLIFVAFPFGAASLAPVLFPDWEQRLGSIPLAMIAVVAGALAGGVVLGVILLIWKVVQSRSA